MKAESSLLSLLESSEVGRCGEMAGLAGDAPHPSRARARGPHASKGAAGAAGRPRGAPRPGRACGLILPRSQSGRPVGRGRGLSGGALTGGWCPRRLKRRRCCRSGAMKAPLCREAPAPAAARRAAAPCRRRCSQRRLDGPLLAGQKRSQGAAGSSRGSGRRRTWASDPVSARV